MFRALLYTLSRGSYIAFIPTVAALICFTSKWKVQLIYTIVAAGLLVTLFAPQMVRERIQTTIVQKQDITGQHMEFEESPQERLKSSVSWQEAIGCSRVTVISSCPALDSSPREERLPATSCDAISPGGGTSLRRQTHAASVRRDSPAPASVARWRPNSAGRNRSTLFAPTLPTARFVRVCNNKLVSGK